MCIYFVRSFVYLPRIHLPWNFGEFSMALFIGYKKSMTTECTETEANLIKD